MRSRGLICAESKSRGIKSAAELKVDTVGADFIVRPLRSNTINDLHVAVRIACSILPTRVAILLPGPLLLGMPASTPRPHWYLIHCKPREDERARDHLERQGYPCYFPTFMAEKMRDRRTVVKQEPLFPRYLFIHLDEVEDNWYPIRSTRGVSSLVCCNGRPIAVHDYVIEGIRVRLAVRTDREPYLRRGERVEITDGPFARLGAIFLANDGDERVVLLLNILQQEHRLTIPVGSVSKVRTSNVR